MITYPDVGYMGIGAGWRGILARLNTDLRALGYTGDVRVKEKYGTLSIEIDAATSAAHDRVLQAEDESSRICEVCGKSGTLIEKNGWWHTRCRKCAGVMPVPGQETVA